MTVPRFIGLLVVLFGILSGTLLVAQPFVTVADVDPFIMAILFAVCLAFGPPLYASGERRALALRVTAAALLALGVFSLVGLFVDGTGLRVALRPILGLWIMLPIGLAGGLLLNYFAGALERVAPTLR